MQRNLILALPLVLLFFESYNYNWSKNLSLDEIENWEEGEYFTDRPVDYSRYQACVPIPYFNIGSGNFWWEPTGWISQKPHTLSMQTGLPLTSAMLTRTSLSQTLNELQLVSEPYRTPKIFDDFPNDKPLLLFWDDVRVKEFGPKFSHLNQRAELLYANDWLHLYELPLASFNCRIADKLNAVSTEMDTLMRRDHNWMCSDSSSQWLYQSYDIQAAEQVYFGGGAFTGNMGHWNRLVDTVWQNDYTGELTISFWQYLNMDRSARTILSWIEYDADTGAELFRQERISRQNTQVFDDRGWALIEYTLPKQKANSRIELIMRSDDKKTGPVFVDELLIRPAEVSVARQMPDGKWWNNRWYPTALEALQNACQ